MNITVLTPDREIFAGPIKSIKVPGVKGEFQVLQNHAPIVSALSAGKVTIVTSAGEYRYYDLGKKELIEGSQADQKIVFQADSGFIEVLNNEVSLLLSGVKA
ncbi:FoF1 ATP synthase subunit delta/epsilon [Haliscomenobacter hydrossis]|uniref:ATPase, F1 complex, delta/epsilon subunit n=1 Tax=Haliscomenobacter hydrossis (strain ATCC 27775 / DSM 1100 / LMG 10767 / O) TaxID=760192 RepID=F4KPN3_HALH1|nr:F0F1 ATP synthase subunit epsilon [Haliscomenobacter hydrossis]AEE50971.1 ATPase, F1 complex, delta/epsilon subunit [Haliscomenobacter hydrossis DSM 1100]